MPAAPSLLPETVARSARTAYVPPQLVSTGREAASKALLGAARRARCHGGGVLCSAENGTLA